MKRGIYLYVLSLLFCSRSVRNTLRQKSRNNIKKNAIILAAGVGTRMVPINTELPKGMLEINGERLIERLIRQLREANIQEIYIIVGFMKEMYKYLQDKYHVQLIYNPSYAEKNNLYSLKKAISYMGDTYIIPSDIWLRKNLFLEKSITSWYMVTNAVDDNSFVRLNRQHELYLIPKSKAGNAMVGIAYLHFHDIEYIKAQILSLTEHDKNKSAFWELALCVRDKFTIPAKVVDVNDVMEINTYEDLRELDHFSNQLKTDAISIISEVLKVNSESIVDIQVLKKGMTNRSFLFRCNRHRYIMRIPGKGTDKLINRKKEANVYYALANHNISDDVIYINSDTGYKISKFLNGTHVCNPLNKDDVKKCMTFLRQFHKMKLKVNHYFDLFSEINFYESLWEGVPSIHKDYLKVKNEVFSLKKFLSYQTIQLSLTHIDAIPDNFLIIKNGMKEKIRLIDWEYAAMQDPHLDIAMFAIYSMYNKRQVDSLINAYFIEGCSEITRTKIYCYISIAGLLWSNWCEYKRILGIEFNEYAEAQYQYAKKYYKFASKRIERYGQEDRGCIE